MKPVVGLVGVLAVILTACTNGAPAPEESTQSRPPQSVGTEREVTFTHGPLTLYGSLRMPDTATETTPAMLLIAGSGPTDRNGDNPAVDGPIGTLRYLADLLARNGFASLRYDKLTTGHTGMGPFRDLSGLSYDEIIDDAEAALNFLATQPGIDRAKIGIVGHSQGALVALALANRATDSLPNLTALALLEPQTQRTLDLMELQITRQLDAAERAGTLSGDNAGLLQALSSAIDQIRTTGAIPDNLPPPLRDIGLVARNSKMLMTQDQLDPAALASQLPAALSVVTTCSDKDIQVPCQDVDRLNEALRHTRLQTVHLTHANHVLKDVGDQPSTGAEYGNPMPYSQQLTTTLSSWLHDLR